MSYLSEGRNKQLTTDYKVSIPIPNIASLHENWFLYDIISLTRITTIKAMNKWFFGLFIK